MGWRAPCFNNTLRGAGPETYSCILPPGHAIFAEQPPVGQSLQQSITLRAGGEGLPEPDHDESCCGRCDGRDTFAKRIAPARRESVVTPAIHEQVERRADVQIGQFRHVALHESGRVHACSVTFRLDTSTAYAGHFDVNHIPSAPGQIDGVAAGAASQVDGASRRQPIGAFDEFDQSVVGHIRGPRTNAQPVSSRPRPSAELNSP